MNLSACFFGLEGSSWYWFGQDPAPKTYIKMGPNYSYKWSYDPYTWPNINGFHWGYFTPKSVEVVGPLLLTGDFRPTFVVEHRCRMWPDSTDITQPYWTPNQPRTHQPRRDPQKVVDKSRLKVGPKPPKTQLVIRRGPVITYSNAIYLFFAMKIGVVHDITPNF